MTDSASFWLFLTTIAGFGYQAWTRHRDRKSLLEDRALAIADRALAAAERKASTLEIIETAKANAEALHIKTEAEAAVLRRLTSQSAAMVRQEQRITTDLITQKLDGVHAAATEAFKEANGVNLKIADYNRQLLEQTSGKTVEKLDGIQHTAEDIQQTVKRIDEKAAL